MLPYTDNVLEALIETEREEVFHTQVVQDLVDYRWSKFGHANHVRGFAFHVLYVCCLLFFVST